MIGVRTPLIQTFELETYHFSFDEGLQGIDLAVVLPLHELHLTERSLTNDLDRDEVLWLLPRPQEAQEPHLCCLDILNLRLLLRFRDIRVREDLLELQRSVVLSMSQLSMFRRCEPAEYVPGVPVTSALNALAEEVADKTSGQTGALDNVVGVLVGVLCRGLVVVK